MAQNFLSGAVMIPRPIARISLVTNPKAPAPGPSEVQATSARSRLGSGIGSGIGAGRTEDDRGLSYVMGHLLNQRRNVGEDLLAANPGYEVQADQLTV